MSETLRRTQEPRRAGERRPAQVQLLLLTWSREIPVSFTVLRVVNVVLARLLWCACVCLFEFNVVTERGLRVSGVFFFFLARCCLRVRRLVFERADYSVADSPLFLQTRARLGPGNVRLARGVCSARSRRGFESRRPRASALPCLRRRWLTAGGPRRRPREPDDPQRRGNWETSWLATPVKRSTARHCY